jgi:peptidoglycan/LPS O-acetylase OafA/YrhL
MRAKGGGDLAERLDGFPNGLNLLRLILATTVVAAHSSDLVTGTNDGRVLPWAGPVAVDCFFAISGFLIARSRERLPLGRYLLHRVARIMPAFWVCLAVTAFVLAPIAGWFVGEGLDWPTAWSYVWRNSLLEIRQLGIGETLSGAPFAHVWNPSLWTLGYEFTCYVMAAVLFTGRWDRGPILAGLVVGIGYLVAQDQVAGQAPLLRLGLFFAAGALLHVLGDRVPDSGWVAGGAATVVTATFFLGSNVYHGVAALPLAYVALWLGAHLPPTRAAETDISYGMYIFGAPLQQLAVVAGVAGAAGPAAFMLISVAITAPVAWASWRLMERPAMSFMKSFSLRGPGRFMTTYRSSATPTATPAPDSR